MKFLLDMTVAPDNRAVEFSRQQQTIPSAGAVQETLSAISEGLCVCVLSYSDTLFTPCFPHCRKCVVIVTDFGHMTQTTNHKRERLSQSHTA